MGSNIQSTARFIQRRDPCQESLYMTICLSTGPWKLPKTSFNPYMTNGFACHYHLGESTLIFRCIRSDITKLTHFLMSFLYANRIAPDGTPRSAASHLGLFCLPMSHKRVSVCLCPTKGILFAYVPQKGFCLPMFHKRDNRLI